MNEMEAFERLARAARNEAALGVDVTARVLDEIRRQRPALDVPLVVFAGVSSVAAVVVVVAAVQAWLASQDPLAAMLSSLTVVMQ